jgi:hypothetical protein
VNLVAVLDRWSVTGAVLEARFSQGPADAPVIYLIVEGLESPSDVEAYLGGIDPFNDPVTLNAVGPTELSLQSEHADPLLLRGTRVDLRTTMLEATDFERAAQLSEEWGQSMHHEWTKLNSRVSDVKHLLRDQRRRLVEKAERHAPESTVRVLYDQQISFIDRVLSKLDT